ncbi:MAG: sigma-54 dependent transcriptional regulator [Acidobacteriota bacterium]
MNRWIDPEQMLWTASADGDVAPAERVLGADRGSGASLKAPPRLTAPGGAPILTPMATRPETADAHIVLVEDDPSQRLLFGRWLELAGWQVTSFADAETCLDHIDSLLPDVVCLDLHLPGMDGHEALAMLKEQYPAVPVLVITGDSEVETVVETMRLGGHDFLVKPVERTRLETQVRNAIAHGRLSLRVTHLEREAGGVTYPGIIGMSQPMRQLYRQIDRIAASPVTVLIRGESGTGKELVAQTIHQHSAASSGPLVAINCAAIPESLQESELFGHEKGAFTGADSRKIGRFEEADGGTLFLDEVAELSASLQAKLLRVLQERTFRRLGGRRDLKSQFRLIAASHADLHQRVKDGAFREDLFYRLAVFELDVPPLRLRSDDVPALAAHFLNDRTLVGERAGLSLSPDALDVLTTYDWPGNVRELANALQRAAVVASQDRIEPADLPPRLRSTVQPLGAAWPETPPGLLGRPFGAPMAGGAPPAPMPGAPLSPPFSPGSGAFKRPFAFAPAIPGSDLGRAVGPGQPGGAPPGSPPELDGADDADDALHRLFEAGPSLQDVEAFAIKRAMERHGSNVSAVARELGIGRNTLYRKMEKYDLRQVVEVDDDGA